MAFKETRVQTPLGMRKSYFFPITAESANAHPTYASEIDLGAAVKGYLTLNVAAASIPGDDVDQVDLELFAGGQLDAETTLNDLEVNATLYGHTFTTEGGEESKADDMAIDGGYAFIEPIFTKDQGVFYRATFLYKVTPLASSGSRKTIPGHGASARTSIPKPPLTLSSNPLHILRPEAEAQRLAIPPAFS